MDQRDNVNVDDFALKNYEGMKRIFEYYQNDFKKIYGDFTAITGDKSLEIDAQIEAVMSHLAVAGVASDITVTESNIRKAFDHLVRACIDTSKLLWLDRKERVDSLMKNSLKRQWCASIPEDDLQRLYNEAQDTAIQARRNELLNTGRTPEESAKGYYDAANKFHNILLSFDPIKLNSIDKFRFAYIIKSQLSGFFFGVLSSALVAVVAWVYLPPPSNQAIAVINPANAIENKKNEDIKAPTPLKETNHIDDLANKNATTDSK